MEISHTKILKYSSGGLILLFIYFVLYLSVSISSNKTMRNNNRYIRDYIETVLQAKGIKCDVSKAYYTKAKRVLINFQLNPEFPYWIDKYYVILRGPNDACEEELIVFDKDKDYESFCKLHRISLYTLKCEWE